MCKEKIYCKNCKWYHPREFMDRSICDEFCKIVEKPHINKITGNKIINYVEGDIKELNKNNDCKYYRRIWWKFWIRR